MLINFRGSMESNISFNKNFNHPNLNDENVETLKKEPKGNKLENGKKFLDTHGFILGSEHSEQLNPREELWYTNMAILLSNSSHLSSETQEKLNYLVLQSFFKVSKFNPEKNPEIQRSPLYQDALYYHRSSILDYNYNSRNILKELDENISNNLGVKAYVVDSDLFKEVLERNLGDEYLNLDNQTYKECIEGIFKKGREHSIESSGEFCVDCSSLIQNEDEAELGVFIQNLYNKFKKLKEDEENCKDNGGTTFNYNFYPLAFCKYKEQDILILPKNIYPYNLREIDNWRSNNGFVVSPDKSIKNLLKCFNFESLLQFKNIKDVKLSLNGTTPKIFNSFEEFFLKAQNQQFCNSSLYGDNHLKVYAEATFNMLRGLKEISCQKKINGESESQCSIEEKFKKLGIEDLLQVAYFSILNSMGEAYLHKEDPVKFYNQIELIHQIIQSILAIAEPFDEKELESAIRKDIKERIVTDLPESKIYLKSSAMHSLSSVISGVEKVKGNKDLVIMAQKNSYYETSSILEAPSFKVSTLDGKKFDQDSKSSLENLQEPIDLFLCEFNHNIAIETDGYHVENVKDQIKAIYENGLASDKMTVALDVTLNDIHSSEIKDLLADPLIKEKIESGVLNLVVFGSAQKFDMLGLDNYYGGTSIVFNNAQNFQSFNERMDLAQDQLKGLPYQGLTLLYKYASDQIQAYKNIISQNNHEFYDKLPEEIKSENLDLSVKEISDEGQVYFLHIAFSNDSPLAGILFKKMFDRFVEQNDLFATERQSFGFMNCNLNRLQDTVWRFTMGLENSDQIEAYTSFFKKIVEVSQECQTIDYKKYINDKKEELENLQKEIAEYESMTDKGPEVSKTLSNLTQRFNQLNQNEMDFGWRKFNTWMEFFEKFNRYPTIDTFAKTFVANEIASKYF